MTSVLQGVTNSVTQFVRVVNTILEYFNPNITIPFIDDIGVKGLYNDYSSKESLLRIH